MRNKLRAGLELAHRVCRNVVFFTFILLGALLGLTAPFQSEAQDAIAAGLIALLTIAIGFFARCELDEGD